MTPADLYTASFNSLVKTLTESGVDAPVFAAIDNQCIFLGADTDALLGTADRREDKCHLSESGQTKTAATYAQAIKTYRRSP